MTEKEALKLALKALETLLDSFQRCEAGYPQHIEMRFAVRDTARIAIDRATEALAQPEQEPVAWMDDYNACKCPDNEARCFSDKVFRMMQKHTDSLVKRQEPVAKVCHDLDGHIGWNPNLKQLPNEGTPLYTTPPQRKPLTDEKISDAVREADFDWHYGWTLDDEEPNRFTKFARAIEAAHGIKGEA